MFAKEHDGLVCRAPASGARFKCEFASCAVTTAASAIRAGEKDAAAAIAMKQQVLNDARAIMRHSAPLEAGDR